MLVAPRALNEPVSWRFSAFSTTRAPTRRDSSPAGSTGVSRTFPAIRRAASSTSWALTASRATAMQSLSAHGHTGRRPPACSPAPRCSRVSSRASCWRWRRWPCRATGSAARSSSARATPGDTCYLLRSGAVVLTREHQDGRMVALAELRGGALFGELAMFRGETPLGHRRGDRALQRGGAAGGRRAAPGQAQPGPRAEAAGHARRARQPHQRAAAPAVLPDRRRQGRERAARADRRRARPRARPRRTS